MGGRLPCLLSSGQFGSGKLQGPNWSEDRRQQLCAGAAVMVLTESKGLVRASHGGFSTQAQDGFTQVPFDPMPSLYL